MSQPRSRKLPRLRTARRADRRTALKHLLIEPLEPRELLATIFVNAAADETTSGDGLTSLREAILLSNGPDASSAPNLIAFTIPGVGIQKISLSPALGALPPITAPVIIEGYSQPGSLVNPPDKTDDDVATPEIQIDGHALAGSNDGLTINTSNCLISGLIITGFSGAGVSIADGASPAQGNLLLGNFIGTLPNPIVNGIPDFPDGREFSLDPTLSNGVGVRITSSNNRVGSNTPGDINVIANNGVGVVIDQPRGTGNLIQGNFILDNAAQGVMVRASNNTIGEALAGGGNVISGNGAQGIEITGGPTVQGNGIVGNFIGPDLGTIAVGPVAAVPLGLTPRLTVNGHLGNGLQGVLIENSPRNYIGTAAVASKNVIGGNTGDGITIDGAASTANRVLNAWIGFNIINNLESLSLANQNGISITAPGNVIGDTAGGSGNTIDHNRGHGILIAGAGASGNLIEGNVVGLNPDGGSAFGNSFDGIHIDNAPGTIIGGTATGARNTISSNNNGIYVLGAGSTGTQIEGNFIGTGVDGLTDLGNAVDGVVLDNSPANAIGGIAPGAGNVISGNNRGVRITGAGSTGNLVQGNFIGTDLTATAIIHNEIDGVLVTAGASGNTIGGTVPAAGNSIDFNVGYGVNLDDGTRNAILSNGIFNNIAGGIFLNPVHNADKLQPAPILSSVTPATSTTNVQGALSKLQSKTSYTVQFFASSSIDPATGLGQGQTFLLSVTITTDASGNAPIAVDLPQSVPTGEYVTATATDPQGNTSTFSNAVQAVPILLRLSAATYTASESDGSVTITVTRTGGAAAAVSIDYSVGGGTAVPGVDYTTVSGTLMWAANDASPKTFQIPILDPKKVGGSVTLNVTLANPTGGATAASPSTATLTVLDNDLASVRLAAPIAAVNENAGTLAFTITRNTTLGTSTVSYATADGTAHAGVNYTTTTGTLTFNPGESSKSISVPILDDHVVTGPLKFTFSLSSPTGAVLGSPALTTVTVLNTDGGVGGTLAQSLSIIVNTTSDDTDPTDGTISLREAIELSNGQLSVASLGAAERSLVTVSPVPPPTGSAPPVPNTIVFNIPGSGIQTITVSTTPLPPITAPVIIDGYSQPGTAISPPDKTEVDINTAIVRIDGLSLGQSQSYDGLAVHAPDCEINGLIITGFSGAGISIADGTAPAQGNWLWGNFLGTMPDPEAGRFFTYDPLLHLGNLGSGVHISASNNRVGGNSPGIPNVIANNGYDLAGNPAGGVGLLIDTPRGTGNLIQGNAIFANAAEGVLVMSSNNTIGEALKGGGNQISGNGGQGIVITGGPNVQGNQLVGNLIGTALGTADAKILKGTVPYPNQGEGILIEDSPKNTVGGFTAAARNVIGEDLLDGVVITGAAAVGNRLLNNFIGFNLVNGVIVFLPNQNGVSITSSGNFIGDPAGNGGNTIDDNRNHGILLLGADASANVIAGNVIGLNPGGGSAFNNAFDGVHIDNAPNNVIGGTISSARNTISSNNNGVYIVGPGATGNLVQGNFIGTATDGVTPLGNAVDGVVIDNAPLNTIGGTAPGAGNVISGNNRGVRITGAASMNNLVQGNFIGTDLSGKVVINNQIDGVLVTAGAANNSIGGTLPGAGNQIDFNAGAGVNLDDGTGNAVLSNGIFDNIGHGIVLNPANNANHLQPAPTLTFVAPTAVLTNVQGTFSAAPNTRFTLQFFSSIAKDPSGFGQGQTLVGSFPVTTDSSGNAPFNMNLPSAVPAGEFVTATATDPSGNTSAFSNALPAVPITLQLGAPTYSANESDGVIPITVTRTGGQGGNVAVDFSVSGGTAVAGTDYTAVSGTLFFNAGDLPTKTFTIPILDAHTVGGSVTVNITLSNAANGSTLGTPSTAVLTIQDNDVPSVELAAATATVAENAGAIALNVSRTSSNGTLTVAFATADGTAVAGVNYVRTFGTLTFNPGESSKSISVPIVDDNRVDGPLAFRFTLSSPTGGALGSPASTAITITDSDSAGTLQLSSASVVASPGAAFAAVRVIRVGGAAGTVTVAYNTGGGNARPGIDYTPVSGSLRFAPGETSKLITVPLKNTTVPGPDLVFVLAIGGPGGGATIGRLNHTIVRIQHGSSGIPTGDTVPPVVLEVLPVAGPAGVAALVVTFNKPMDPARASNVGSYGYFLTAPGPDGVYGTFDDQTIAITSAAYDAPNHRAILFLGSPLALGVFGRFVFNANASTLLSQGLADLSGNLLDGTGTGQNPGTVYAGYVGEGASLSYLDRSGDAVTLRLSEPGLMALIRGGDGEARSLRLLGTAAGRTSLTGQLRRPSGGGGGSTSIPSIAGAAGVQINLSYPTFRIGGISASAVDALAVSGALSSGRGRRRPR
jgi:CSLREA domain-containing protein